MAVAPVSSATSSGASAFGLDFQSLLQIILAQLTAQDPLKPVDNTEFVTQLAEFSQLQQTQTLNTSITTLLTTQAAIQATGLLGRTVSTAAGTNSAAITGVVQSVSFSSGQPQITIKTTAGQTIANLPITSVVEVQ